MSTVASPPKWAEALLRLFLKSSAFSTVSGDLLEQYRDSIYPARGPRRADAWYVAQVLGFVWRGAWPWAVMFAAAFVGRGALDWLIAPTTDFHTRSQVSMYLAAGILLGVGFWTAWRSGSFAAGAVAGITITAIAAVLSAGATVALLAIWHDPATMAAIRGSGGLEESFVLPVMIILPGAAIAAAGGVVGATARRLARAA